MNNQLPNWQNPQKPAELTYNRLVQSILDGSLQPNSLLPNERQLAEALGLTRSTLREALQRLSANGLVDILGLKHLKEWREYVACVKIEDQGTFNEHIHNEEALSEKFRLSYQLTCRDNSCLNV